MQINCCKHASGTSAVQLPLVVPSARTVSAKFFEVTPHILFTWRRRYSFGVAAKRSDLKTTRRHSHKVVAVSLEKRLLSALDDLCAVVQEFMRQLSQAKKRRHKLKSQLFEKLRYYLPICDISNFFPECHQVVH